MAKDGTNKTFWQRFAKIYTVFMKQNDNVYQKMCDKLEQYLDSDKTVLELACGTGQLTFKMADKSHLWEATDYSENMLKEASKRNTNERMRDKICFCVQDATDLSYENEKFDVVVIANALHIMPEPDKALIEIHRVLKADGILFAPTFVYEKGYSKPIIWLMEKAGFKTYHKWQKNEFSEYIRNSGFHVIETTLLKGKPLSECVLIGRKIIP